MSAHLANPLDTPLPCDVKVGPWTFCKGVPLSTFVMTAQRWHREAFPDGYTLTDAEKAANLARLQSVCATESQPPIPSAQEWLRSSQRSEPEKWADGWDECRAAIARAQGAA